MREQTPPTRRPWLRFSLRWMLILVALVCLYLGWAMSWIRERHAYLETLRQGSGRTVEIAAEGPVPWSLRLLNESGRATFYFRKAQEEDLKEASRLFPEAKVYFFEVTNNDVRLIAEVPYRLSPPVNMLPYYQNGVLYREELLVPVSDP
jgi:hypothetical protein